MIRYLLALTLAVFLSGCATTTQNVEPVSDVPSEIQEAIATDLFDVLRIEFPPESGPISLDPTSPGEQQLDTLLRQAGYTVDGSSDQNRTHLRIYFDAAEYLYIGSVVVGFKRRMTRQYRYDAEGLVTVGTTAIGA